jgi:hypothetical protein
MSLEKNLKNNSVINQTKVNNTNNLFSLKNNVTPNNTQNINMSSASIKKNTNINNTKTNVNTKSNINTKTNNILEYENDSMVKNITNNKQSESTKGMFKSAANSVSEYYQMATGNETLMLVFKMILGVIFLIILINIVKYFYIRWANEKVGSPLLVDGTKNGKQAMVISQDPNHTNYIPINRSVNKEGIEFSYSLWFVISDLTYKQGEWKHVFHKGNSTSYPNRAPGVWIHPTNNIMRIYMNTMKEILEYVDIDNIPLRKWVHMSIVVKNRSMSIFVNGFLKIRKELTSLPRQNYGNVWVNLFGGFDGYVSQLQYFDHALEASDIAEAVMKGPSQGSCIDTKEKPPYLDDSWWLN